MINNSSTLSSWWNNFNNGDEALFNDASRPRDSYWFKMQPWMQSDKWDQRDVNKNIYLDQCIVRWARKITWNSTRYYSYDTDQINLYTDLKWKINIWTYTQYWWRTLTSAYIEDNYETYIKWNLWWTCKNWRLVIPTSWSYFINYYVEFLYSSSHNVSQSYKNLTLLNSYGKDWVYKWVYHQRSMPRLNAQDNCWSTTIQDLEQWEIIWLSAMHSKDNEETLVAWTLIVIKLS